MSVPVPATVPSVVPQTEYDRWGVADITLVTNLMTGSVRVGCNARKASATGFSPYSGVGPDGLRHGHNVQIGDLVAEFADDPEALGAIQSVMGGILLLVRKKLTKMGVR